MQRFSSNTVMITGASRGIGASAARAFADAGANVVLSARGTDAITALAGEIGERALAVPCDVSRYADVQNVVRQATDRFGGVDILINNAGVIEPIAALAESSPTEWGRVIDINLKGAYYGIHAVLPVMKDGGTIITISSGAAHNPLEGWSHYCVSKAGAAMLTDCAHKEFGHRLRVMGLSPGTVATQMQREIKASGINPVSRLNWSEHIPPEWPAQTLMWMCSPDADEFKGQEISLRNEQIRQRAGITA